MKKRDILKEIGMREEFDVWKEHALEYMKGPPREGDRVKVIRKPDALEEWNDSWVSQMDASIGLTGTIRSVDERERVHISFDRGERFLGTYSYPRFVLKRV